MALHNVNADVATATELAKVLEDTGTTLDTLVKDIPTVAEFEARTMVTASYATATELSKLETLSANHTRYIGTAANMTLIAWNTVAAHEVFVVTGCARLRMWITCTTGLASALDGATLTFGVAGAPAAFIASTAEDAIDTGELWYAAAPATVHGTFGSAVMDYVVNGVDVGYTIVDEALTTGFLTFHCVWEPLSAGATVAIGGGGPF